MKSVICPKEIKTAYGGRKEMEAGEPCIRNEDEARRRRTQLRGLLRDLGFYRKSRGRRMDKSRQLLKLHKQRPDILFYGLQKLKSHRLTSTYRKLFAPLGDLGYK